ncbi:MAG: DUF4956 domain-containing protein [Lachnospiraceae bacterium]|nr:DUF4956 domain-containing protein [Lachnospiraceae bacterium]
MILATTTFSDIFKSSFLEEQTSISYTDVLLALGLALVLGLLIRWIYKRTFAGVMYSSSFGLSLVALSLVTTFVILAVTSNVVLSLGMVGALSIVRFRSAIREPIEIAYLFWAIAVGIVTGAGLLFLAIIGSLIIAAVLLIASFFKSAKQPYILVVHCADGEAESHIMKVVEESVSRSNLKSKSVSPMGMELTIEVRLNVDETQFVNRIAGIKKVSDAVLVSYNGEYMS